MQIASPDNRLFRAFGNWVIKRAMRTPYTHLFHDDGRPYMERFWLFRLGTSRSNESGECYPWFGMRVHHIQSGDDRVFHDHPWNFATLILRGSYTEKTPYICRDGTEHPIFLISDHFTAGSLRSVKATQWHYLALEPQIDTWTLFITFPKRQSWGFLVNGIKVPWRQYLADRAAEKQVTTP